QSDKKQAEKLVKNIIKIVIKIGVLIRNDEFNDAELQTAEKFRKKFQKALAECQYLLKSIIKRHLTEKSIARVDEIFKFFRDDKLLEMAFRPNSPYSDVMANLVSDLNKSLDEEYSLREFTARVAAAFKLLRENSSASGDRALRQMGQVPCNSSHGTMQFSW
uniref:Uncharacterized protein n=1 Tax=Lutzomyia longipalpis TaxID=7200 RepID=A0A1B0CF81_LUTLO